MGCLPDGTGLRCIVEKGQVHPDGIVVDNAARHIYWTNMGNPLVNDGSIYRADFDGKNVVAIVPQGSTYTLNNCKLTSLIVIYTGVIARACALCDVSSMALRLKH